MIKIRAANKHPVNVLGAFRAVFSGSSPKGEVIKCDGVVYVSDSVQGFFLSYETMVDLLIINRDFPTIGAQPLTQEGQTATLSSSSEPQVGVLDSDCPNQGDDGISCECPPRSLVPSRPTSLPFEATEENCERMRKWLLERYAGSTFNVCLS